MVALEETHISDELGYYGVIADQSNETDYQLCAGVLNLPPASNKYLFHKIQYNQKEVSLVSCTLHGALGAISDLTGYIFTLEERKALWDACIAAGSDNVRGGLIVTAINQARKYWNQKNPDNLLMTFRMDMGSQEFIDAIAKDYSVVIGINGNSAYSKDFNADGKLDQTSFGASTYGHCIRMVQDPDKNDIIDNYVNTSNVNVYQIPAENLKKLVASWTFMNSAYVFVFKKDFDNYNQDMPQIPTFALNSVNKAVNKGIMEPKDINNEMTVQQIEAALIKLGIFTKQEGSITEMRFAIALDRLKALG